MMKVIKEIVIEVELILTWEECIFNECMANEATFMGLRLIILWCSLRRKIAVSVVCNDNDGVLG